MWIVDNSVEKPVNKNVNNFFVDKLRVWGSYTLEISTNKG